MTIDQVEEDRGLVGDIAMGILVGKIQEMLGITTTPKPRPIIGILIEAISCFFSFSSSSSSSPPTTAKSKSQNQKNLKMYCTMYMLSSDGIAGLLGGETTTTAAPPTDEEK